MAISFNHSSLSVGCLRGRWNGWASRMALVDFWCARADRRSVRSSSSLGRESRGDPCGHIDVSLVVLLHPGVLQKLSISWSCVGLFQEAVIFKVSQESRDGRHDRDTYQLATKS